jgi:CAAX prenyl protease-like protein
MSQKLPGQAPKMLSGNGSAPKSRKKRISMRDRMPWLPYVFPYIVFVLLSALDKPFEAFYPFYYTVKIAATVAAIITVWRFLPEAKPNRQGVGLGVAMGIALALVWVFGSQVTPHIAFLEKILGTRVAYNPYHEIANPILRVMFLAVRFFGMVIVVPIIEEVFYRGFLLRFVTDPDDFRRVAIGRFTLGAFLFNVVLMAFSHPEWLVAAIFSAAMCSLVARTRSVFACIVAHGVTNLLLGIYVLWSHQWQYW